MATPFSTLILRFRQRVRDTKVTYSISDTLVKAYINSGKDEATRLVPWLEDELNLGIFRYAIGYDALANPYVVTNEFLMTQEAANFLRLKRLSIPTSGGLVIERHPEGIDYIRKEQIAGNVVAGTPEYYAVKDQRIFFDRLIANPLIILADIYIKADDLVYTTVPAVDTSLPGLLGDGFDDGAEGGGPGGDGFGEGVGECGEDAADPGSSLGEVTGLEVVPGEQVKHVALDGRPDRFDQVEDEGVPPRLVGVQDSERGV
jgi:hypothetical protein